ncbi:GTPase [Candidatus Methylocalor cossyra]|uniref:50S ribosome-binding GTPase n=1 Tax=Candidatus Methylocalor cossyra TaxID=3108543 RepID=A0ABM9NLY0_9GAMM
MPNTPSRAPFPAPVEPRWRNAIVYNLGWSATPEAVPPFMLSFLRLLKSRYESLLRQLPEEEERRRLELGSVLPSLWLAESFLERGELERSAPRRPLQIAVLGPTQAGKSSIINWLLQKDLAKVSPLAGFTVQPQGFAVDVPAEELAWAEGYFRPYTRMSRDALPKDRYDCFSLEVVPAAERRDPLRGTVLWDTPDFDSIDADDYRQSVLRVAALADLVLLVLSKDKYADLSVWELMGLLEPLGQPTLLCLNKVEPASLPALATSLREKWHAARRDPPRPVIALPYLEQGEGLASLAEPRAQLLAELDQARRAVHRDRLGAQARALVAAHWARWVAPVKAEHRFQSEWRALVDTALRDSLQLYQRDYLNHPHHYETFQRALAELLTLLEIPGIGGALLAARKIVTWPLRQLTKLGQAVTGRSPVAQDGAELAVLNQAAQHLFIRLGESLLLRHDDDATEQGWWRELAALFRDDKALLKQRFDQRVADYLRSFRPEIDRTARRLYDHLREHPAILNGLRATRATTDAAALAVALHTGGIGVQDFVIAPAVLSLTSMLAEGALGRFMDRAAAELKQKQLAAVEKLFRDALYGHLVRLPGRLDASRRFDIPPETLAAVEARGL